MQVVEQLPKIEDLFFKSFSKMKGISSSLGEMKIYLKLGTKPTKKSPYHLNPKYKVHAKKELYRILNVMIIFPI